jgi:hypothetical protein
MAGCRPAPVTAGVVAGVPLVNPKEGGMLALGSRARDAVAG